ncbi:MAG: SPOR domain-containing protein [Betaproteobacteria bacterium]
MNDQRGSTLIGFIAGLVLGLAVALAVAVYVTKAPVPFLHEAPSRSAGQDADESRKNKDWDPNAPLYGKNPARPASAPAPEGAASAPASAGSAAKAPVVSASAVKPGADPLGDLAKAKAAAVSDSFIYFVQAGAFRTPEDAEAQRVKLSLAGVEAKVSEREQSGRNVFRVRVGPIDGKDEADKTKERLDGAGFETALIRVPR